MPRSPEQAPFPEEEPTKNKEKIDEATRKKEAVKRGLPETANLGEIVAAVDEENRKKAAAKLGLSETATWMEIHVARGKAYRKKE